MKNKFTNFSDFKKIDFRWKGVEMNFKLMGLGVVIITKMDSSIR